MMEKKQALVDSRVYISQVNAEGTALPDEGLVFCLEVLKSFMSGGVPINKIYHFRPLLEKAGQLTGRQHLADLISMVRETRRGIW